MKILRILALAALALAGLVATIFTFIEFRSLFAGDFTLMQDPTSSAVGYICRGLFYLMMIGAAVTTFINYIINKKTQITLLVLSMALVLCSVFLFFFYMVAIALVVAVFNVLILLIANFGFKPEESKASE